MYICIYILCGQSSLARDSLIARSSRAKVYDIVIEAINILPCNCRQQNWNFIYLQKTLVGLALT